MKSRINLRCVTVLIFLSLFSHALGQSSAFSVLYNFAANPNSTNSSGSFPVGLVLSGNELYGTAEFGGTGESGTVFAFDSTSAKLSTLYNFTSLTPSPNGSVNIDGAEPNGLIFSSGALYGTAQEGGPSGTGAVFALNSSGGGFSHLHDFAAAVYSPGSGLGTNSDGFYPTPGLIILGNTLYGTAEQGGGSGSGTIFSVNINGTGWTVLHSFSAVSNGTNSDGAYPMGGLALAGNVLYGTAKSGGNSGNGIVFAVNTDGTGFTTLYNFTAASFNGSGEFINGDGMEPEAGLALTNDTLYGTATAGGAGGTGTVFAVNTDGTGFTTLHSFAPASLDINSDGIAPVADLTLSGGTLYGTASDGGSDQSGTVFAVNTNGSDFSVLYTFSGGDDGANPYAPLVVSGNILYGVASEGGSEAAGTLFSLYVGPRDPPLISVEPVSQTVNVGDNVTLQVAATGIGTLNYQWSRNGGKISGATSDSLSLNKVTAADAGSYEVVISDSGGSVVSSVAMVTVLVPPSITTQPADQTEPFAGTATFTIKAADAPLFYQWFFTEEGQTASIPLSDGGAISGSATNKLSISPVTSNNVGNYFVVISNSATAVTSKVVQLNLSVEKTKPSVTITSPKSATRMTNPVLSGTASDAVRVLSVGYWVTNKNNGVITVLSGHAALASGSTSVSNWTIQTTLLPGTNILAVQSTNYAGLSSSRPSVTFFYEVPAIFTLVINGPGTITGKASVAKDVVPANNALLNIGEGYTLTAAPANNFLLSNWVADSFTSNSPTLNFIMESNLTITANFATNFFMVAAGTYNGLFSGSNVTAQTAGMLKNLVVRSTGAYSGTLLLGGGTYSLSPGAFDASMNASATVKRAESEGGPVGIEMTLDWANGEVTGSVSNLSSGGWESSLEAEKSAAMSPSAEYTLLLSPGTNAVGEIAPGDGYMLITNHNGTVTLNGALADGTSFSQSVPLGMAGDVPIFHALYNNAGLLMGWLNLPNITVGADAAMAWLKPAARTGLYPDGFTNLLSVTGSPWTGSLADGQSGVLTITDPTLSLDIAVSMTNNTMVKTSNDPTNSLTVKVAPKTGLLTIIFGNGNAKATTTGHGVLLQNTTNGGGYFVTGTNSGAINLTP